MNRGDFSPVFKLNVLKVKSDFTHAVTRWRWKPVMTMKFRWTPWFCMSDRPECTFWMFNSVSWVYGVFLERFGLWDVRPVEINHTNTLILHSICLIFTYWASDVPSSAVFFFSLNPHMKKFSGKAHTDGTGFCMSQRSGGSDRHVSAFYLELVWKDV